MLQEVVFCKSVFEKIVQLFDKRELWDSKLYYQNLQLKKIITIPSNWRLIEKWIEKNEGFHEVFKNHIYTEGKLYCYVPKKQQKYSNDEKINLLLNLTNESESKILHTEVKHIKNSENERLLQELEVADISQFNNPPADSRLVSVSRNIKIFRWDHFHFDKILKSYFNQTKILIVSDKFIRNSKEAYINLKRFIGMCPDLRVLTIYTDKKEDYSLKVEKMREEIKELFQISPIIESASAHRRTITTDKFNIKIDPGLDFVNEAYVAEKHDFDIQIELLKQQF